MNIHVILHPTDCSVPSDFAFRIGGANFCPRKTPYINTIPVSLQPPRPGDADLERSITSLIHWNAL